MYTSLELTSIGNLPFRLDKSEDVVIRNTRGSGITQTIDRALHIFHGRICCCTGGWEILLGPNTNGSSRSARARARASSGTFVFLPANAKEADTGYIPEWVF
jgi:hypothetical protein